MAESDRELLVRIDERLNGLHREMLGNGQPGLKQRVESLEGSRNTLYGLVISIPVIGGFFEWLLHRK